MGGGLDTMRPTPLTQSLHCHLGSNTDHTFSIFLTQLLIHRQIAHVHHVTLDNTLSIKHGEQARNLTTLFETVQEGRGLSEAHTGQTTGARVTRRHYVDNLNFAEDRLIEMLRLLSSQTV